MKASEYLASLPFAPDPFQVRAAAAIDSGESVVVTAPTGSGKTVVAEAAIARTLGMGRRAFYTTPIKALSNQKFGDFRHSHGSARVGLLTGDNVINGSAPIVVMTTEVLRNMMYAGSPDLEDLGVVVLDEVHYLQDRARGAVWEEIIIHLDSSIPLVCLSATIANAGEFASWVEDRRGHTALIVESRRPVPLESTYLMRDRWERGGLRLVPVFHGDRPNERILRMLRAAGRGKQRYGTPRRHETARLLERKGLLPAIHFVFSRKGCDQAVDQVVSRGLRLTTASEAAEIVATAEANTAHLSETDLSVIGYRTWLRGLEAGVAPHHAGLVPAMKETAEQLFSAGLIRLVFATETLALGINMPARTVVLESLSKFTGEGHELLQPGDYTQLTGRAGRRGIDDEGTAVILHSRFVDFARVAGIAARGSHPLQSSFRPTYNMAVNLVARYERDRAEQLLASSFAEFSDRRRRHDTAGDLAEDRRRLDALVRKAEAVDTDVFAMLDREPDSLRSRLEEFVAATAPGDVLEWSDQGAYRRHAVVARGTGRQPRLLLVSDAGELRRIAAGRLPERVRRIGQIALETPFRPRDASYRRRVAEALATHDPDPDLVVEISQPPDLSADVRQALDAARRARRLEQAITRRESRLGAIGPGIVHSFRSLLGLLEDWGYVDGWELTLKGSRLRQIYNELDLLVAEALSRRWFVGLDGKDTAALASAFTFEPRQDTPEAVWPREIAHLGGEVEQLWHELSTAERRAGLPPTRPPEAGFAGRARAWADGATLADLFGEGEEGSVGDFVRTTRQLIDLLRQLRDLDDSIPGFRDAIAALDRGVVAAEGAL